MAKYIITTPSGHKYPLTSDTASSHIVFYAVINPTLTWLEAGKTDNPAEWIDNYADAYYAMNALIAFSPVREVA